MTKKALIKLDEEINAIKNGNLPIRKIFFTKGQAGSYKNLVFRWCKEQRDKVVTGEQLRGLEEKLPIIKFYKTEKEKGEIWVVELVGKKERKK